MLMSKGIWRSKEEANAVRRKPYHMKAKREGLPMYRNILIKELELIIEAGLRDFKIEERNDYPVKGEMS